MRLLIGHRDSERIADWSYRMGTEGYRVIGVTDAEAFRAQCLGGEFDMGIAELGIFDGERTGDAQRWCTIPVIGLASRMEDRHIVPALDRIFTVILPASASYEQIAAQMRALGRLEARSELPESESDDRRRLTVQEGRFRFDLMTDRCEVEDRQISLTGKERKLLQYLAHANGRVASRRELFERIWGSDSGENERSIDVHIRYLRRRFEMQGMADAIETVRGSGYRLAEIYRIPEPLH